ncbi:hypothetical protein AB3X52_13290 [Nocardioides sp. DS6]|uniref:Uncharacterized protein n=1 Tax=Nocardioides eburneus TaxID=3231482 RepID=A0ABV3T1Q6_9ACTN
MSASVEGDAVGLSLDKDGVWLEGAHKKTTDDVTVVEHAKVRAPEGTPPPAGEPQRVPIQVPNPFAPLTNLVHNATSTAEDGLSSLGSHLSSEGHHLAHNAEAWGDYLGDKLRDLPEGGGLPTIPGPIPIPIIPAF